ncbi:HTH-type transcriptional regulator GlpR [Halobellus rarus]|uniref:HTH-type transcriptional regulator GlpR n=1 Tax=Halobellus rarus TaxID=1126237 RepID=A0ABD6CQR2_9EURY|nr:HTH-type transcriptional regulator GlpR [Halobellus rarus]
MLPEKRREYIVELVIEENGCTVSELAEELDISETTVRRDLDELADRNSINRTHGGAVPVVERLSDYERRTIQNREAKETIAKRAVKEIHNEQVVLLDAGSTTQAIGSEIPKDYNISVVTNNPPVASRLAEAETEVFLTGGRYNEDHNFLVGRLAEEAIEQMNFDLAFIGVEGIHSDGLTTVFNDAARIKELMVKNSRRVVVVADHSKIGARSVIQFADLSDVDMVITDKPIAHDLRESLVEAGIEVTDDLD